MGYSSKPINRDDSRVSTWHSTSIFVDPSLDMIEGAKKKGTDRIELYTCASILLAIKSYRTLYRSSSFSNDLELVSMQA
jgi:pyridoxine 5'-phosphate synthase PdxJ